MAVTAGRSSRESPPSSPSGCSTAERGLTGLFAKKPAPVEVINDADPEKLIKALT